eukprot:m.117685 g.117685  ORF g.117685 m.117685 type:complete len:263 (-) comp15551_c0_seq1:1332-2120(-)
MLTDFCHAAILMDVTAEAFMQAASMQAHDPETQAVLNEEPTQRKPHKRKVQHAKVTHAAKTQLQDKVIGGSRKLEQSLRDACSQGSYDKVLELVGDGVNVNAADEKKRSPLHFAAVKGDASVVKFLLDHGASPHSRDMNGNTPLHLAACTNATAVITQLLRGGCDARATDGMGRTALDYAAGHLKLMKRYKTSTTPQEYSAKVLHVVHLLQECLKQLGDDAKMHDVNVLEAQFASVTTADQVDSLEGMLEGLVQLSLTKHQG